MCAAAERCETCSLEHCASLATASISTACLVLFGPDVGSAPVRHPMLSGCCTCPCIPLSVALRQAEEAVSGTTGGRGSTTRAVPLCHDGVSHHITQ